MGLGLGLGWMQRIDPKVAQIGYTYLPGSTTKLKYSNTNIAQLTFNWQETDYFLEALAPAAPAPAPAPYKRVR